MLEMRTAISERKNDLSTPVQKPSALKVVEWSSTMLENTIVYQFGLPDALALNQTLPISAMLEVFKLFRSNFKVTARLNTVKMQQGRLVMAWVPMDVALSSSLNLYNLQNYPHVKLDAANSTVAELDIAFESIQAMLTTNANNTFDTLGTVYLAVINPLTTKLLTGENTTADVTIYLTAKDEELRIAALREALQIPTFRLDDVLNLSSYRLSPQQRREVERMVSKRLTFQQESGLIQTVFEEGKKTIEDIEQMNFGSVLQRGANLLMSAGLDNPIDSSIYCNQKPMAINPINAGVGKSRIEQLDIINNQIDVSTRAQLTSALDEMNIPTLCQRMSQFAKRTWSTTQKPGATIFSHLPVSPILSHSVPVPGMDGLFDFTPTFLAHNTVPFFYWSGAIKFRFEIVKTDFHSGRLYFAWIPNIAVGDVLDLDITTIQAFPGALIDLQQASEVSIVVPWNKSTPYGMTSFDVTNSTSLYYDPDPELPSTEIPAFTTNGRLVVMVINSLVAAGPVADAVEINCYIGADKDYKLRHRASQYLSPVIGFPTPPTTTFEQEAGTVDVQSTLMQASKESADAYTEFGETLTHKPSDTSPDMSKSAELHLKSLLSSYSLVATRPIITSNLAVPIRPVYSSSFGSITDIGIASGFDVLSHFASQFCFFRGSLNYKILFDTNKNIRCQGVVVHETSNFSDSFGGQDFLPIGSYTFKSASYKQPFNLAFQPSIEVGIPFKVPYLRILNSVNEIGSTKDPLCDTLGQLSIYFFSDPDKLLDSTRITLYRAFGDDAELHLVIAPPIQRQRSVAA